MIVSCPACSKRIKLDRQRFAGKRIKLRCVACGEVFQAEIPPLDTATPTSGVHPPLILVAHSDVALCETVGEVLSRHSIPWASCHDGDEALRMMDAAPPRVVLVDVALPGLFAFEVVDKVRRRQGLESIKIILLSSVYNKMAYKRRPHSLYGADDYIEKHHIPTDLIDKVRRLVPEAMGGVPPTAASNNAEQGTDEAWKLADALNSRLLQAEESESAVAKNDALVLEKAQRLARIIASDIALYNQSKVEEGIRTDRFYELLAAEVAEGRKHFMEKIPADVPGREAILQEAFENLISRRRNELQL